MVSISKQFEADVKEQKCLLAPGTICVFFRYFRTNKPMEGRTMSRTNLAKNGFSEALLFTNAKLNIHLEFLPKNTTILICGVGYCTYFWRIIIRCDLYPTTTKMQISTTNSIESKSLANSVMVLVINGKKQA